MVHRICSTLVASGLLLGSIATLAPTGADACTAVDRQFYVHAWDRPLTIPLEGVIVFSAVDYGAGIPLVIVRDGDGVEVPGSADTQALREPTTRPGYYPTSTAALLLVWRADAPLTPGGTYTVEVMSEASYTDIAPFEVTAATEPFGGLDAAPALEDVVAARKMVSVELRMTCDEPASIGECPTCRYTDLVEQTAVGASIEAGWVDPFTVHRLVAETGAPIIRDQAMWVGDVDGAGSSDLRTGSLYFDPSADEYCFHVESESLVDGSVVAGPSTCVPASEVAPLPAEPRGSDGGCSATGGADGLPAWGVLFPLLALAFVRRR